MDTSSRAYGAHIRELSRRYDEALAATRFDAVLVGAGLPVAIFRDDQEHPFRADPLFVQWAPLLAHPGSALLYRPGHRPVLLVLATDDYWHQAAPVPPGPWQRVLDLRVINDRKALVRATRRLGRVALLGDPAQWRGIGMAGSANPKALLTRLDYARAVKTDWEVGCIRRANVLGLAGHIAVQEGFAAGLSEFELGLLFLAATGQTDAELPYPAIIAQNANGATLHYQHRDRRRLPARERRSLLVDAGCTVDGYASDITRTHAARRGDFAAMVKDLDQAQQHLCALVRPGARFPELQLAAHRAVAVLLQRWGVARMDPDDMVARRVTDAFLPHGLGHLLGLQVHDVGGGLAGPRGGSLPRPARFPRLRLTRTLEPGQVVTVEPGIYFITPLLKRLRARPEGRRIQWGRVAELAGYGGIRIEDDVLVTPGGHANLTRGPSGRS